MTPTGISAGETTVRATTSHASRKTPPAASEAGTSRRCSGPNASRHACGTIIPTKPIGPHCDTTAAVINETVKNSTVRTRPTFTPRAPEFSSPSVRMSSSRVSSAAAASPATSAGTILSASAKPVANTPPIIQ